MKTHLTLSIDKYVLDEFRTKYPMNLSQTVQRVMERMLDA